MVDRMKRSDVFSCFLYFILIIHTNLKNLSDFWKQLELPWIHPCVSLHSVDCEQSLSSPNFSEKLASEVRSFLPLFCIIYSFHSRVGSEENRTTARSLYTA